MKPDRTQGLTCYVDADFAGNWTSDQASDPRACLSRTGFVIFHANCPVTWQSKLQSAISLSTTEAECVALSSAMRDVMCLVHLIEEIKEAGVELPTASQPKTICGVFEDNELARMATKIAHACQLNLTVTDPWHFLIGTHKA